jgi:hypothetical protein
MMPHEPVRDIMRRTMKNLEFIEARATADGPYEVTQLINSFLGALAHPWESLRADLNAMPLSEAVARGWPNIAKERENDVEPRSLGNLVRFMRNGVAHGNLTFLPGSEGEIQAIRVVNKDPKKNYRRTWGAIVTVEDMRVFLVRFVTVVEDAP